MSNFTPSEEQARAIHYQGDMVIMARPGSGKTSVLSCKIRNIVSELRPYQGVIAISYTNKASDELERRCRANAFDVKSSFFGTIDKFCLNEIIYPFMRHIIPSNRELKAVDFSEMPKPLLPYKEKPDGFLDLIEHDYCIAVQLLWKSLEEGFIPLNAVGAIARYVLENSEACQKYLTAHYRAICIDEYQDSGLHQHNLFLALNYYGLMAVAVGDSDQSIFAFAKKDSRYLLELPSKCFTRFDITTNFRSHPSINDYALRLLNPAHPIAPTNDNRVFIKRVDGDQRAIGTWLSTAIPHLMSHYHVPSANKVAILCRSENSMRLIAEQLRIPSHIFENSPFMETPKEEADIFSDLLKLRHDRQLTAETLIEKAGLHLLSPKDLKALRQSLIYCRSCLDTDLIATVLNAFTVLTGQLPSDTGRSELEAICGDASKLRFFHTQSPDAVQIMTLHKSKGMEFDLVFHADLYDHVLPKRRYPPNTFGQVFFENYEQCLNLHYVGITRAVKACVLLTSNRRLNGNGEDKPGAPSQFIGQNGVDATPITW